MKRVRGVVLLFASVGILCLISDDTVAKDIVLSTAGFAAAIVTGLAVAGSLCFLAQCAPLARGVALLRSFTKTAGASPVDPALNGRVHHTQGQKP